MITCSGCLYPSEKCSCKPLKAAMPEPVPQQIPFGTRHAWSQFCKIKKTLVSETMKLSAPPDWFIELMNQNARLLKRRLERLDMRLADKSAENNELRSARDILDYDLQVARKTTRANQVARRREYARAVKFEQQLINLKKRIEKTVLNYVTSSAEEKTSASIADLIDMEAAARKLKR